jgi:hypothetical protein
LTHAALTVAQPSSQGLSASQTLPAAKRVAYSVLLELHAADDKQGKRAEPA